MDLYLFVLWTTKAFEPRNNRITLMSNPLVDAAENGELMDACGPINDVTSSCDHMCCVVTGKIAEVRRLIRSGSDVNSVDSDGNTGLIQASLNGDDIWWWWHEANAVWMNEWLCLMIVCMRWEDICMIWLIIECRSPWVCVWVHQRVRWYWLWRL